MLACKYDLFERHRHLRAHRNLTQKQLPLLTEFSQATIAHVFYYAKDIEFINQTKFPYLAPTTYHPTSTKKPLIG